MFDMNTKQYILELSTGKKLTIFYRSRVGICISTLKQNDSWNTPSVIMRHAAPDFSVSTDKLDNIHILCQDRYLNLVYLSNAEGVWNRKQIFKVPKSGPYNKYPTILNSGDYIYSICVLREGKNNLLLFQILEDLDRHQEPQLVDYIAICEKPYIVCKDDKNLYFLYKHKNAKKSFIGYKEYNTSSQKLSEFSTITECGENCEILSACVDQHRNLHVWWQKTLLQHPQEFQLIYSKRIKHSDKWTAQKILHSCKNPYYSSSYVYTSDSIIYYYTRADKIYSIKSSDNGDTWENPEEYYFHPTKSKYCIAYLSNALNKYSNILFKELPGVFSPRLELAFTNNFNPQNANEQSTGNPKNNSCNKNIFQCLEQRIEQLENKVENLESKLTQCKKTNSNCQMSQAIDLNENTAKKQKEVTQDILPATFSSNPDVNVSPSKPNKPMMPGAAFKKITPEYLKKLKGEAYKNPFEDK